MPTALLPGIDVDDPDVGALHGVGDVAQQRLDPLDLDRRAELDLVAGDRRAAGEAGDGGVDLELSSTPVSAAMTTSLALVRAFGGEPFLRSIWRAACSRRRRKRELLARTGDGGDRGRRTRTIRDAPDLHHGVDVGAWDHDGLVLGRDLRRVGAVDHR